MGELKVKKQGVWVPALPYPVPGPPGDQGPQGPGGVDGDPGEPGAPIPNGGLTGQYLRKSGLLDYATEWSDSVPRGLVFHTSVGSVNCPTANTFADILTGSVTIDPTRLYQIVGGIRAIDDTGADCNANCTLVLGAASIFDDYWGCTGAGIAIWGCWSQQTIEAGNVLNTGAAPVAVTFTMRVKLSIAAKLVYEPMLSVYDVGAI